MAAGSGGRVPAPGSPGGTGMTARTSRARQAPLAIGVLGLGEAGSEIAGGLAAAGVRVRGFDPAQPAPAGVEAAAGDADACRGAALVISLVTAEEAEDALRMALPGLAGSAVYADANTSAAGLKQRLAGIAAQAGIMFADVAIMAPVPGRGLAVPMLVSGPGAGATSAILATCGAQAEIVAGPPGTAAARKLLRSVFYKGMAAAAIEALRAARAVGSEDWLREHLAAELAAADAATLARLEDGSYRHAHRRAQEMAAASTLLSELGVPARIARASQEWLADLAADLPPGG
jgi:3-hydroxyisobutyrate dehydrogenase-like beta-hydroxyacid dehydrogenase